MINPFQTFGGKELYPSIQAKAARLCFGLVKNHAMLDGNKRLGAHVMLVFLALNGYELSYSQKELSDVILALASGDIGEWKFCSGLLNINNKPSAFESEIHQLHKLYLCNFGNGRYDTILKVLVFHLGGTLM